MYLPMLLTSFGDSDARTEKGEGGGVGGGGGGNPPIEKYEMSLS